MKVLPCLQEISLEDPKPTFIVENFDTWFQEDLNVINQVFQRENKDSLSELWVGMLNYYAKEFQFERNLVQVSFLREKNNPPIRSDFLFRSLGSDRIQSDGTI